MRLLITTTLFPPATPVGALRAGALARYLPRHGWDVDVVTLDAAGEAPPLPAWVRRLGAPHELSGRPSAGRTSAVHRSRRLMGLRSILAKHLYYPGPERGFLISGGVAALERARARPPDLVYATGPSWVGLLLGLMVSSRLGVPLVSEFRDIWVGGLYGPQVGLTPLLDRLLEASVVNGSEAVVCVTPTAARRMRRRYPAARVIENRVGFEPELLASRLAEPTFSGFRLTHAGSLYGGRRSPAKLLAAMAALGRSDPELASKVRVDFYGPDSDTVLATARDHGVAHQVRSLGPVQRDVARREVGASHAQLVLLYEHPDEITAIPAKAYEAVAIGRPILAIGPRGNPTEEIVARVPGSAYVSSSGGIEAWLRRQVGRPLPPPPDVSDLAHDAVVAELSSILVELLAR